MTIQQIYGRSTTHGYKSKHGENTNLPLPNWLVGIELEIEGWNEEASHEFGGMSFTDDGSLRRNKDGIGIEAITLPIAIKHVPAFLKAFFKKYSIDENNYSERCSTHVHFNVEPLEYVQVGTIALVYQTVERLLFNFVGNGREGNIFCVPWNQCSLSYNIVNKLEKEGNDVFRRWQKYSALNLIPIVNQGTIEFRHLHGTCDVSLITNWICLLAKIVEYAQKVDLATAQQEILQMNTVSNYHSWMQMVFGEYVPLLQMPNFEAALSRGVIDSKLMVMESGSSKKTNSARPQMVIMDEMVMDDLADERTLRDTAPGYPFPTIAAPTAIGDTERIQLILNRMQTRDRGISQVQNYFHDSVIVGSMTNPPPPVPEQAPEF